MSDAATTHSTMPFLTGLVICQDSARTLERCLASLSFCDELVVVDGGSRDSTPAIIARFTDNGFTRPYTGTNDQKEYARRLAKGQWVLNLDSDEWVTPELAAEIQRVIRDDQLPGYRIPVRSRLGGRWLRRGGWYPNFQKRLFKRDLGRWDTRHEPHDRVVLSGSWGRLDLPIEHEPGETLGILEEKARRYGRQAAAALAASGYRGNPADARLRPWWRYLKSFVFKGGFLDGELGHHLARISYLEAVEKYRPWR